jgi:hypothetical protein
VYLIILARWRFHLLWPTHLFALRATFAKITSSLLVIHFLLAHFESIPSPTPHPPWYNLRVVYREISCSLGTKRFVCRLGPVTYALRSLVPETYGGLLLLERLIRAGV